MTRPEFVPSQHLPVRSKTYPLRDSAKKSRRAKHGEALDAAELYRRLNELIKHDRGRYLLGHQSPRPRGATVSSKPYHHVPQTAAKDFTRTTAIRTDRDKPGLLFSQSLPTPNSSAQLRKHRDAWQGPKASNFGLHGSNATVATVKGSGDAAGLQRSKTSGKERLTLERYRDQARGHGGNIYDSLVEARIGIRRSSTGDVVSEHLPTIDLGTQPGSHALAHKITRQHLEDKTDWTQNDVFEDEAKQNLTEWMAPLFRSLAKKGDIDSDDAADGTSHRSRDRNGSRRRSSLLSRYFAKKAPEQA